jgi:hypothetical protein
MIMPCRSGGKHSRGRPQPTASERHLAQASAALITCVRSPAPRTYGIPGDHARMPQIWADMPD